jgi:hypothetical protein
MLGRFFGVHHYVIRSGLWAQMKPGEKDLYICLMEMSERWRTREVTVTDAEIAKAVGVEPRTLCNARKKLCERHLVRCGDAGRRGHTYVICDPETGLPYPGDPKTPVKYQKQPVQTDRGTAPKQPESYGTRLEF